MAEPGRAPWVSSESVGAVLDAYAELARGDAAALVAMLDPGVEWIEWAGNREARRLVGVDAVARVLLECARNDVAAECTGAAKVGADSVAIEFAEPWWTPRRRRLAATLARESFQVLTLGPLIERIESYSSLQAHAGERLHAISG